MGGGFELAGWGGGGVDDVLHRVGGGGVEAGAGAFEGLDLLGDDVDDALGFLQLSFDDEEGLAAHEGAFLQVEIEMDDGVDQADLVFQQQEGDALGGAGTLAADDQTGQLDGDAVRQRLPVVWR